MRLFIHTIVTVILFSSSLSIASENIPNLVGTWVGINKTVSEDRGTGLGKKKLKFLSKMKDVSKVNFLTLMEQKTFLG